MRTAAVVAGLIVLLASQANAGPSPERWPWAHTRWANESGRLLLVKAVDQSAVVRCLVEDLERSDVFVYVKGEMSLIDGAPKGGQQAAAAHLVFGVAAGGIRYLHVTVDTWLAGGWDAVPLLGHELQHALEVAAAPEVRDQRSFETLYSRIGWQSGTQTYETDRARATGRRIQNELLMARAAR